MWDVTGEQFLREQRDAAELGETAEWGDYIPVAGESAPPEEYAGRGRRSAAANRLARPLRFVRGLWAEGFARVGRLIVAGCNARLTHGRTKR
jgi:hypothetical protein